MIHERFLFKDVIKRKICAAICQSSGIKAKEIARQLNIERNTVNHILYKSALMNELCYQDDKYRWRGIIRQEWPHNSDKDFRLIVVKVDDWNLDLSPWQAPAVFGKDAFGGGASDTLSAMLPLCEDKTKTYYIGGYSLAGLFALWAAYQTDTFKGVAAASPSVWFPNFENYVIHNRIQTEAVYLSLGDKEEKTRNPVMTQVGNAIRSIHHHLDDSHINCALEWNQGNHFKEADIRTAKAFAWLLNRP